MPRFPWYVIAWHILWIVPVFIARVLFAGLAGIFNLSFRTAREAWEATVGGNRIGG